jgi:hypothetical protein
VAQWPQFEQKSEQPREQDGMGWWAANEGVTVRREAAGFRRATASVNLAQVQAA